MLFWLGCQPKVVEPLVDTDPAPAAVTLSAGQINLWIKGDMGAPDSVVVRFGDSLLLDGLGQVYSWSLNEHILRKIRSASEIVNAPPPELRYRNQRLGRLTSIDLTNPMRPLLFYSEAQTVVWLDRNLTELRQLPLVDLNLGRIDAVAYAPNDALWLYTPDRQQLLLIDRQLTIVQQSPNFSQLFNGPIRANQLVATAQQVSLASADGRILIFGPFASYRSQILQAGRYLLANENQLLFHESGQWWSYGGKIDGIQPISIDPEKGNLLMLRGEKSLWRKGRIAWVENL